MRSIKTRGIVIKRMNYGEADRILTVFTERLGKVKILAKGVRKITSKMAGNLEPYNLLEMELHEGKTFYTVTSTNIVECFDCDMALSNSTQAVYISEIIDKVFEESEKNTLAFEIFADSLRYIRNSKNDLALRLFELKILEQAGFQPDFYDCAACKKKLLPGQNYINKVSADLLCGDCANHTGVAEKIDDGVIKLLRLLQERGVEVCDKISCDAAHITQTEKILDQLLQNALERELKSKKYLSS